MTPFAAVLVVLLFTVMVFKTTEHNSRADLPKVVHPIEMPDARREDAVVIAVTRDGKIFFGNDWITAKDLPANIEERLSHGAERKVYINADARARYGSVGAVLNGVRSAGVENVGILVRTTLGGTPPD
jgi:biopolymer transport protein TolR